jgi:superfamily II DNA or RNA helicase
VATSEYHAFLERKKPRIESRGFEAEFLPDVLWDFQKEAVRISTSRGRNALFEDCGMGKTVQQLTWAENVRRKCNKPVLIVAPLAVAEQTKAESEQRLGIECVVCRESGDAHPGLNITNYEMLHKFNPHDFAGLVIDESSILKGYTSKFRAQVTEFGNAMPYRLACTATPAPNDWVELLNHSEFLGVLRGKEAIALFFTQDGNTTHAWRLKGHAKKDFWRWVAGWSVAMQKPSDLGYSDDGFSLPPLNIIQHTSSGHIDEGFLVPVMANTLQERAAARRESIGERVEIAASIANATNGQVLVWCDMNAESASLARSIDGAAEVTGSDSVEKKCATMTAFSRGELRVLVTKPSIAGFGMNWQNCHTQVFTGLSDSFEKFYQAVRRCWRYGQKNAVDVHVVCAETEGAVVANIQRKERQSEEMMREIVREMRNVWKRESPRLSYHEAGEFQSPAWLKGEVN